MNAVINTVLSRYGLSEPRVTGLSGGTNESYRVDAAEGTFLLQRPNDAAEPARTEDIAAVTEHLTRKGIETPCIVRASGELEVVHEGRWRLCTWVPGRTVKPELMSDDEASSMAILLARFHDALSDYARPFQPRHPFHQADAIISHLRAVHDGHESHPMHARIGVATSRIGPIIRDASRIAVPSRACHGDPKVANVVFWADSATARALIDLGAVGAYPIPLDAGDMLRSICSRERFDSERFRRALDAYVQASSSLTAEEAAAIPDGTRLVMAELAARYLIDVYEERVFVGKTNDERCARAERLIDHSEHLA